MPGRPTAQRGVGARSVRLVVGGREATVNGFVRDVFQEAVVGLVRALGTEDESRTIELTIGELETARAE